MQPQIRQRALTWAVGAALVVVATVLATGGVVLSSHAKVRGTCQAASCSSGTSLKTNKLRTPGTSSSTSKTAAEHESPAPTAQSTPEAVKWDTPLPGAHLAAPIVAATSALAGKELLLVASDGGVFPVGQPGFYGSLGGHPLSAPVTAAAADTTTGGYWLAGADGGVFAFNAPYLRGVSKNRLFAPIVAMAGTPDGRGYWLVGGDGGVFAFGDAGFYGSVSKVRLSTPVVAMAATPDGRGYWLVGGDGGVFALGDAGFYGSVSKVRLSTPVVAMAATPDGRGYWLVGGDGGVFTFGDAGYFGAANRGGNSVAIRALVPTPSGRGYWLTGMIGSVFSFGDAPRVTSIAATTASAEPRVPAEPSLAVAPARKVRAIVHSDTVRYSPGSSGYDISQYQCGQVPGTAQKISVVQVTGGYLDSYPNPCYVREAKWAGPNMSAYIYMSGLPSPVPPSAVRGPRGACSASNIPCQSYNFGWNWTTHWVAYSKSVGIDPRLWWLDVERYSGWNGTLSNDLVVTGALDALRSQHLAVGIYSSSDQWDEIMGSLPLPGYPLWVPGAGNRAGAGYTAFTFCRSGQYAFAGGEVKVVQFGYQGPFPGSYSGPAIPYDRDYAC